MSATRGSAACAVLHGEASIDGPEVQALQPGGIEHVQAEPDDGRRERDDGRGEAAVADLEEPRAVAGLRQPPFGRPPSSLVRVAAAPVEHRRREHVVVQLPADPAVRLRGGDGPEDPVALERLERRLQRLRRGIRELAELLRAQRDLAAARRHEEAQRLRCCVALGVGHAGQRVVDVRPDDRAGAPEPSERLDAQQPRAGGRLLVPDPLHHELQVGGLDAHAVAGRRARRRVLADRHAPAPHLLQHGVHERRFDVPPHLVVGEAPVERRHGLDERPARGGLVEEVEMQVVAVDVRDPALEPLPDERVGVLAHRDEEVRRDRAVDDARRELVVEGVLVGRRVHEALLELVEDHEQRRAGRIRHVRDGVGQPVAAGRRLPSAGGRRAAPRATR